MARTEDLSGTMLAGCRVLHRLGRGGMGSVYAGLQAFLERPVAIKVLSSRFSTDPEFIARFEAEGRILASLRHANIAQIYSMGLDRGRFCLVMEHVQGQDLATRLEAQGPLSPTEAAYLFLQVAAALDDAGQRNVVHRDVKPANIMVTPGGLAKLVDFGIASSPGAGEGDRVTGSIAYMSPEQASGLALDQRSDLYSLGITMWHALAGELPFDGATPLRLALQHAVTPLPRLPERIPLLLQNLVERLASKNPVDRPRDAAEVRAALNAYLASAPKAPWALIVEPDPARARAHAAAATAHDLLPIGCGSGDEALAVLDLRVTRPHVIVTALTLPGADGLAVLRRAQRLAGDEPVRAIVLSEFDALLDSAAAEAFRMGLHCVTGRPGQDQWLRATLGGLLGRATAPVEVVDLHLAPADPDAERRVARLEALGAVDDLPPDAELQGIVEHVAEALEVPIVLVSLVTADRQWFKAHTGLSGALLAARGTPIEEAFCHHVVASGAPLVVSDAAEDAYFRDNALVRAGAVGSYAGAPVVTATGEAIGTLCVIDGAPRATTRAELDSLVVLARRVAGRLHLMAPAGVQGRDFSALTGLADHVVFDAAALDRLPDPSLAVLVCDERGVVRHASPGAGRLLDCAPAELVGLPRAAYVTRVAQLYDESAEEVMRVSVADPYAASGVIAAPRADFDLRWSAWPVNGPEGRTQIEVLRRESRTETVPSFAATRP